MGIMYVCMYVCMYVYTPCDPIKQTHDIPMIRIISSFICWAPTVSLTTAVAWALHL